MTRGGSFDEFADTYCAARAGNDAGNGGILFQCLMISSAGQAGRPTKPLFRANTKSPLISIIEGLRPDGHAANSRCLF